MYNEICKQKIDTVKVNNVADEKHRQSTAADLPWTKGTLPVTKQMMKPLYLWSIPTSNGYFRFC